MSDRAATRPRRGPSNHPQVRQRIQVMQLIALALATGPLLFLAVLLLSADARPVAESGASLVRLSLAHGFFFLAVLAAMPFAYRAQLRSAALREALALPEDDAAFLCFLQAYQVALLMRLAPLEGVALFGLVIGFLAGPGWHEDPRLLLNLASLVFLLAFTLLTLPTESRLRELYVRLRRQH